MIRLDIWAEARRLHRSEGLPIKEIARRLGLARNTVRSALRSDAPPSLVRGPRGSRVDGVEPQVRALLGSYPRMPATVIAERIGWEHSLTVLKDRVRQIRPEYTGVDPADRLVFGPGEVAQCDLWFPDALIPVGFGQERVLPVLVMTQGFSRRHDAVMLPSRQGGDLLSGMWELIDRVGRVPRALLWDREPAIGGRGKLTDAAAGFAGTLGIRIKLAPPRDPETKGRVERGNGYFETSFLPGRLFSSPEDFNTQLTEWLQGQANERVVRSLHARPSDVFEKDRQAMLELPPVPPAIGLTHRVRLARDYYIRIDGNDYSVDPSFIGRFVDATATPTEVIIRCDGQPAGRHPRCWATHQTLTDPEHVRVAAGLRAHYQAQQRRDPVRRHPDGHPVQLRALSDYDTLFGVEFDTPTQDHQQKGAQRS